MCKVHGRAMFSLWGQRRLLSNLSFDAWPLTSISEKSVGHNFLPGSNFSKFEENLSSQQRGTRNTTRGNKDW